MVKILSITLILFSLIFSSCNTLLAGQTEENLLPHSHNSILPLESFVKIEKHVFKGNEEVYGASGSGTIVKKKDGKTFILTAKHICDKDLELIAAGLAPTKYEFVILDYDENKHPATVKIMSDRYDMCILEIKYELLNKEVKVSKIQPEIGDKAFNISAPYGIFNKHMALIYEGIYSGQMPDPLTANSVTDIYSIPTKGGSSGSPVFNEHGELIGMIFAGFTRMESIAISTTFSQVIDFLKLALNS